VDTSLQGIDTETDYATAWDARDTDSGTAGSPLSELGCSIEVKDETEATISDAGVIEVVGETKETTMLFIFDKSGSMGSYWGNLSRWQAASNALVEAIEAAYSILGDKLRVGAILFPMPGNCEVVGLDDNRQLGFMPADQFIDTWQEAISSNGPTGSTPLEKALQVANQALVEKPAHPVNGHKNET
jgi:Mg-chelatase subunit ChlD